MHSSPGQGSKFDLRVPFKLNLDSNSAIIAPARILSALIFGANQTCLMEIRSLFDRASINTETSLIDNREGAGPIKECIQRNLACLDLIIFDLRHLQINLNHVLDWELDRSVRIIIMHYDRDIAAVIPHEKLEFISVINTSKALAQQLYDFPGQQQITVNEYPQIDPGPGKLVLLVDDNQINLKLASEFIRLWGHRVIEADHGDKALELYNQHKFDLIILDIQMPDIDGASLLLMMRDLNPTDSTPVVALTANILKQEAQRLLDLGFDYYLSKPIDEIKFRALLDGIPNQDSKDAPKPDSDFDTAMTCSVDYDKSLALSADNDALLKQIFEILLHDIPDHQYQLKKALELSQHDKLSAIAHKLHGATCYVGLPRLRRSVLAFQHLLARNDHSSLQHPVAEINSELEAIKEEVQQFLAKMDARGEA